jgi:hypothetical protein
MSAVSEMTSRGLRAQKKIWVTPKLNSSTPAEEATKVTYIYEADDEAGPS